MEANCSSHGGFTLVAPLIMTHSLVNLCVTTNSYSSEPVSTFSNIWYIFALLLTTGLSLCSTAIAQNIILAWNYDIYILILFISLMLKKITNTPFLCCGLLCMPNLSKTL